MLVVDDFGRFDARLPIVKGRALALYDLTTSEIQGQLAELEANGLAVLYEDEAGRPYLKLTNTEKHWSARAKKSKYPGPSGDSCDHLQTKENQNISTRARATNTTTNTNTNTTTNRAQPERPAPASGPTAYNVADAHRDLVVAHNAKTGRDTRAALTDPDRWSMEREQWWVSSYLNVSRVPPEPGYQEQIDLLRWAFAAPPWSDGGSWADVLSGSRPAESWLRSAPKVYDQKQRARRAPKTDEERHRASAALERTKEREERLFLEQLKRDREKS